MLTLFTLLLMDWGEVTREPSIVLSGSADITHDVKVGWTFSCRKQRKGRYYLTVLLKDKEGSPLSGQSVALVSSVFGTDGQFAKTGKTGVAKFGPLPELEAWINDPSKAEGSFSLSYARETERRVPGRPRDLASFRVPVQAVRLAQDAKSAYAARLTAYFAATASELSDPQPTQQSPEG